MLVATRWEYGSRLNADGFECRRFLPALKRVAGTVTFVPVEARHQIVRRIESFLRPGQTTIVLSVFQAVQSIPPDYFQLAERGVYLANWHTDDDMLFEPFSTCVADRFHLNITTYEPNLPRYEALGAGVVASQWGGLADCGFRPSRRYAACFVGRMYGRRDPLARRLRREFGDKVFVHDTRVKPISDEAMILAYQDSWLAVDDPLAYDGKTLQIKARIFENASMGCVVVTQPNERLGRYYEPGREILFWETPADLVAMVRDCLDDTDRYKRKARAAYDRTRAEHLYEHRFAAIFDHITQRSSAVL